MKNFIWVVIYMLTVSVMIPGNTYSQGGSYLWTGAVSTDFTISGNWNPSRTSANSFDKLFFNTGGSISVTNVPNQQMVSLSIGSNTAVTMIGSSTNTLTFTKPDSCLYIGPGSTLISSPGTANNLLFSIPPGTYGLCDGILDFETTAASGAQMNISVPATFTFKPGSECIQNCLGNVFGSNSGNNVVIFENGSKFTQKKGSNPFALTAPNSKVQFNHGSLFSMQQNAAPSFSGRTYANLEINNAAFSQSGVGASACIMDSLILTSCTLLGLNLTGGVTINGNINLQSGTLNFIPASAGNYTLSGTGTFLNNAGTLVIGPNATVTNTNTSSLTSGTLTVNGILNAGSNNLLGSGASSSLTGSGTIKLSGSIASQISGYNSNTFSGVYEFTGNAQSIPSGTYSNLKINGSGTTLSGDVSVSGILTLTSGTISLGSNTLTILSGGSVTAGSLTSYVRTNGAGGLKFASMPTLTSVSFPIGNSDYNPVILNYSGSIRDWTASVADAISSGTIGNNPTAIVNREWNITPSNLVGIIANMTLQWNTSNEGAGFVEGNPLNIAHYDAGTGGWYPYPSSDIATGTAGASSHITTENGLTSFSPFAVANDGPLPVELSSFNSILNGRNLTLRWTTNIEVNNSGFEIQRKEAETNSWVKLSFITGIGNSNVSHNYSFIDNNLSSGKYIYRLKQIDFNGDTKYYDLANEVILAAPGKFSLSQNYPNPFNPTTKINFDVPADSKIRLEVFDITGRSVAVLFDGFKNAGYYTLDFNASSFSSGTIFYKLDAGEVHILKRMMLIK
ncbi:hypothetical protein BH10BAC5_BH10BAC5_23400 [soil metagenome]